MQLVYQTNNLFDAHLVKHALEDAGIPAFVFGESLLGAGGELPLFGLLRVCVPDAAKPEADDIVAAVAAAQDWQEATVKTLLNRLLKKKAIAATRDGRRYLYRAITRRGDYVHAESTSLLDRLFGGRVALS